jgi:transcriptional regulator with XRE-family HTH domain
MGAAALAKGFQDSRYRDLIGLLVAERKRQGLSQEKLAERLGRHQQFVSRFEIGERRLDAVELLDICRELGLSAGKMLDAIPAG